MGESGQEQLRQRLVIVGRELYQRRYVSACEGNISLRTGSGNVLISAAGSNLGKLNSADIIEIDLAGKQTGTQSSRDSGPSSESGMHLAVYIARGEVSACVHSHAPYATAYAVAGKEPEEDILPEVVALVGPIRLTQYASPGTPEVGESLQPFLTECNAFLLKNHGLLTIGESLKVAHQRHEIVESYLKILTIASSLGNIDKLPPAEIGRLKNLLAES